MSLDRYFCSSPWFHMKINNSGQYSYCRWSHKEHIVSINNIKNQTPQDYFQSTMQTVRKAMLSGQEIASCKECHLQDQLGKVSGRQRQLLKTGIMLDDFEKTLSSSPWHSEFQTTLHSDRTDLMPQDWQIDLGNFCNSGCLFCNPWSSSKLATEWMKVGLINQLPPSNWCNDPVLLDRFLDTLENSSALRYLHFIGGETLITPAFSRILGKLIDRGLHQRVTVGFTTNLTVWDDGIVEQLLNFKEVNLGMSVECLGRANDYARWPSQIDQVQDVMKKWMDLAASHDWLVQIRTTPTILTIHDLISLHDYAWKNNVSIESCNFIEDPAYMRPSVLPMQYRQPIIERFDDWISSHDDDHDTIINTRNHHTARSQIVQDAKSYINYLRQQPDESDKLPELVKYLKLMDQSRGNCVLDYLPEYEQLFRSAGY